MSDLNLRPKFHITGDEGWINDPNGLIKFGGKYHVFYQSYPADINWGPIIWGHSVSDDLTHWEYLPHALYPDRKYDRDGCFSGSAIEFNGKLYLMYTGYSVNGGGSNIRQVQCLAESSDGVSFKKLGVVISADELPDGYSKADFRDPKVWRENGKFYALMAARVKHGRGRLLLYSSDDLLSWKFEFDVFGKDCDGIMLECPDYKPELGLLIYSEQFAPVEGSKHLNIHTTRFVVGKLDFEKKCFMQTGDSDICDYGFDFYAPQTFSEENIAIGWMDMWDRSHPSSQFGFSGMLTVPRRLSVKNGRMVQSPIVATVPAVEKSVKSNLVDKIKTGVISLRATELSALTLKMRCGGGYYTSLKLDGDEWIFDRSASGTEIRGHEKDLDSVRGLRRMPFIHKPTTELTVVFDKYSVEIFEDGRALTATIYPPDDADGLELEVKADKCSVQRFDI